MNVNLRSAGGPLEQLAHMLAQRNAAPKPRPSTAAPVPAASGVQLMPTVPGMTTASSPAGRVPAPGEAGIGAPIVTPYVAVGGGLGLRLDVLA